MNNIVDLDNNMNLSYNYTESNTTALTNLEKPATLYLHGLSFNNPRILRNNDVCPVSVGNNFHHLLI